MKILGASSGEPLGGFLHAGYGSVMSQPHGLKPDLPAFDRGEIALQVDVDKALATEPVAAVEVSTPGVAAPLATPDSGAGMSYGPPWPQMGLFFALLLVLHLARTRLRLSRAAVTCVALAGSVLLVCSSFGWLVPARAGSPEVVSDEAAPRRYVDPELATKVILYGLLADQLAAVSQPLALSVALGQRKHLGEREQLSDFGSVRFPTRHETARMEYAMSHHTRDGWGRPFWIAWRAEPETPAPGAPPERKMDRLVGTLSSAGADGKLDTDDDIAVRIQPGIGNKLAWDHWHDIYNQRPGGYRPTTYFIRLIDGRPTLFFRGIPNLIPFLQGYVDTQQALALTGDERFDLVPAELYRLRQGPAARKYIPANLKRIYREVTGGRPNALVLVVPNAP
jgi:hypothetical protein